jgi:hypothetical protein
MPAWRREAEHLLAAVVGGAPPPWREWDDLGAALASEPVVLLSLVGHAPSADERHRGFAALQATLGADVVLVVADHNRPRRRSQALAAVLGPPAVPGLSPATRWRRLARPTAREVQTAGFRVVRLALVARERVQLVIARRTAP